MTKKILVLPGDGIGPEIVGEAVKVLEALKADYGLDVDIDSALLDCDILIPLVDHDAFKAIPLAERGAPERRRCRRHLQEIGDLRLGDAGRQRLHRDPLRLRSGEAPDCAGPAPFPRYRPD